MTNLRLWIITWHVLFVCPILNVLQNTLEHLIYSIVKATFTVVAPMQRFYDTHGVDCLRSSVPLKKPFHRTELMSEMVPAVMWSNMEVKTQRALNLTASVILLWWAKNSYDWSLKQATESNGISIMDGFFMLQQSEIC